MSKWIDNRFVEEEDGVEVVTSFMNEYKDAVNGDVYLNPGFGDLWIVDNGEFIKINDGYSIDIDAPVGFIKVGHLDVTQNKRK